MVYGGISAAAAPSAPVLSSQSRSGQKEWKETLHSLPAGLRGKSWTSWSISLRLLINLNYVELHDFTEVIHLLCETEDPT